MAVFKCKMCGGALEVNNETVAVCEYCGTKQTLPKLDDDRKANLYDRANHFRRNNEFDKAMGIYEQILNEDNSDAEAYWSLVLCRYGIEYVEDPATKKRIPTVNRAQFTSIFDDEDYKSALKYADGFQKDIYEQEAATINEIQKGILAISNQEEPFDVFICYKESDNNGRRTPDSVLATELYHELTREGYKVFFSRITLEDKLGSAYEPYIFAALNSAKVMVVLGTKPEYFNAVWVRNEWSRFLALIKNGARKMLIPAYKDMDPYDLPEEFSHLQAQDMSKLGFMQDLIRGIKKIVESNSEKPTIHETVITNEVTGNVAALLKRGYMALEDGEWSKADDFFEQCLNQNAELAEAYLGKLMAELQVKTQEGLKDCAKPFDNSNNYQKILRFADDKLKGFISNVIEFINNRNESERLDKTYNHAVKEMNFATKELNFISAAELFESISGYKDADALAIECREKAKVAHKDAIYKKACEVLDYGHNWAGKKTDIKAYEDAIAHFRYLNGWRDSEEKILLCQKRIEEIKAQLEKERIEQEQERLEKERQAELERIEEEKKRKQNRVLTAIFVPVVAIILVAVIILSSVDFNKTINISAGGHHSVGLKEDGTVVAVGDNDDGQCNIENWTNIIAISAGYDYTVGLKKDGMVVAVGNNANGQRNIENWTNIIAISAGYYHTVGLKEDGTVVAAGDNAFGQRDVKSWTDIIAISASDYHTVGLKKDGTVVAVGKNIYGQCNVKNWTDIIAISAGNYHTVGLKKDGTVVAVGDNNDGQCDVENWTDIIAISVGRSHTIGLKKDGTVVAVGKNIYGQCNVENWTDIIAISAGTFHTVGLKKDGTVVTTGENLHGQCNVGVWKKIN